LVLIDKPIFADPKKILQSLSNNARKQPEDITPSMAALSVQDTGPAKKDSSNTQIVVKYLDIGLSESDVRSFFESNQCSVRSF
jgi:hypothetical protein